MLNFGASKPRVGGGPGPPGPPLDPRLLVIVSQAVFPVPLGNFVLRSIVEQHIYKVIIYSF